MQCRAPHHKRDMLYVTKKSVARRRESWIMDKPLGAHRIVSPPAGSKHPG
jgi:hypothetical protein